MCLISLENGIEMGSKSRFSVDLMPFRRAVVIII